MVDKAAFFSKINSSDASTDFIGLKYAMWAYAATQSSSYSSMSKQFYLSAREFLERSEAESTSGVPTITDLQISILLAFYELTQTLFTRAWMSISRTTWLAQMLELHHMDHKSSSKSRPSSPYDSADHEERRRTFWAAYSLSCFSSVGIGWNTSNALDFQEVSRPGGAEFGQEKTTGLIISLDLDSHAHSRSRRCALFKTVDVEPSMQNVGQSSSLALPGHASRIHDLQLVLRSRQTIAT